MVQRNLKHLKWIHWSKNISLFNTCGQFLRNIFIINWSFFFVSFCSNRTRLEGGEKRIRKNSDKDVAKDGQQPTEEMVERMEERLEAAQADQKNLFLIIFQVK